MRHARSGPVATARWWPGPGPVRTARRVAAFACLAAASLEAQYFGQNRVRYDRHDTQVLTTPHFDIHFDAPVERTAREVGRKAERWVTRLAPFFGGSAWQGRKPLILYTNHPDFQQTRLLPEDPSEGTRAFAEAIRNRIVMPILGTGHETDHVLGHEIVHLMQFDMAARVPGMGAPRSSRCRCGGSKARPNIFRSAASTR